MSPTSIITPPTEAPIMEPRFECDEDTRDEEVEGTLADFDDVDGLMSGSTLQTSLIYTRIGCINQLTNIPDNRRELAKGSSSHPFEERMNVGRLLTRHLHRLVHYKYSWMCCLACGRRSLQFENPE